MADCQQTGLDCRAANKLLRFIGSENLEKNDIRGGKYYVKKK